MLSAQQQEEADKWQCLGIVQRLAVLHQKALPSNWQEHSYYCSFILQTSFLGHFPPTSAPKELYEHSQLLPGSARLDNSSTELKEYVQVC